MILIHFQNEINAINVAYIAKLGFHMQKTNNSAS